MNQTNETAETLKKMNFSWDKICPPERLLDIQIAGWIVLVEGIATVVLNIIVIGLIVVQKKKSIMAFLILHLAISDLSVALFHDFPKMVEYHYPWPAGENMCICYQITKEIPLYASTYLLVSLSIDRLIAIKSPLSTTRGRKRYKFVLVFIPWALGLVLSLPYLKSHVQDRCGDFEKSSRLWCLVNLHGVYGAVVINIKTMLLVIVPAVLLISMYGYIFYLLKHRSSTDNRRDCSPSNMLRSNQSAALERAKQRSLLVTVAVGVVFIICWLPSSLATYIVGLNEDMALTGSFYTLGALQALNSLANPIIILIFNYKMFKEESSKQTLSKKLTMTTSLKGSEHKDHVQTELIKENCVD